MPTLMRCGFVSKSVVKGKEAKRKRKQYFEENNLWKKFKSMFCNYIYYVYI